MMTVEQQTNVRLYQAGEVMRRAHVSFRQVDHWTRIGALVAVRGANGSGSKRLFSATEVLVAQSLGACSNLGLLIDTALMRAMADHIRAHGIKATFRYGGFFALDVEKLLVVTDERRRPARPRPKVKVVH